MAAITNNIAQVISQLQQGNVAAVPTETVYGLAGNALNKTAIKKIYTLKKRPVNHPLIMHVAAQWSLDQWVLPIPDYCYSLIDAFWPGPLTLVMHKKPGIINDAITGGQDTIAIRCPKHPLTQQLLSELNFPLAAPSANLFGKLSPTTAEHVLDNFKNDSLLILDGGRCPVGIESTIIDVTNPDGYQLLRAGTIDKHALAKVIPHRLLTGINTLRVPGKLNSHYQPVKPLYCFTNSDQLQQFINKTDKSIYVLSFTKLSAANVVGHYQLPTNNQQTAFELYYQLSLADNSNAAVIAIEMPPEQPEWQAIREKILKASTSLTEPFC